MDDSLPGTVQLWIMSIIGAILYPIRMFMEWYGQLIVDWCTILGLDPYQWAIIQWVQEVLGVSHSPFY